MASKRNRTPFEDGEIRESADNGSPPKDNPDPSQAIKKTPARAAKNDTKTVFDLEKIPRKSPPAEVRKERERQGAQRKAASARLDQERAHRVTERQSKRREPTPEIARSRKAPSKTAQRYAASQAKKAAAAVKRAPAAAAKKTPAPAKAAAGPTKVTKPSKSGGPTAKELKNAPKHIDAIRALIKTLEKDNEGGYDDALAALHRAAEVLPVPEVPSSPETPPRRHGMRTARAKGKKSVKVVDDDEDEHS